MKQTLKVKKLHPDAIIPTRGSEKASGLDLYALQTYTIGASGKTTQVKTGIAFQIPEGYEIQVRPRSGLSLKTGLRVANSPGTVDQDYLGDCSVLMYSADGKDYEIQRGERIGQAVLVPVAIPTLEEVTEFDLKTERGTQGFGSTGK